VHLDGVNVRILFWFFVWNIFGGVVVLGYKPINHAVRGFFGLFYLHLLTGFFTAFL
jgi:hypothetical protein